MGVLVFFFVCLLSTVEGQQILITWAAIASF